MDGMEEAGKGYGVEKNDALRTQRLYPPTVESGFALSAETYLNQKLNMIVMLPVTTQKKRKLKALVN